MQTFIVGRHPPSNGLMEITNRKMLEILHHFASKLQESWENWLPHVAMYINGSGNASTEKTPHYIVYGSNKRQPYELIVQPRKPVYNCDDYAKVRFNTL